MGKLYALMVLCLCLAPIMALGEEPVQIRTVLQQPAEYHLRIIHLKGIAVDVRRIEDYHNYKQGGSCVGAYAFLLRDDAADIVVEVLTTCGESRDITQVQEDQMVSIDARIEAPGYYAGQGRPLGELVTSTRAVALKFYPE